MTDSTLDIAQDVVADYAATVCDDLAHCSCSMARLSRALATPHEGDRIGTEPRQVFP